MRSKKTLSYFSKLIQGSQETLKILSVEINVRFIVIIIFSTIISVLDDIDSIEMLLSSTFNTKSNKMAGLKTIISSLRTLDVLSKVKLIISVPKFFLDVFVAMDGDEILRRFNNFGCLVTRLNLKSMFHT